MKDNIGLGKIRISFGGSKSFSISQIGNIFSIIEDIYNCFSKQIFETTDFILIINNIKQELAAFDVIASTKDDKPIKYSTFEEITMCVLFSIYSTTFENNLEIIDTKAKSIHTNVFKLFCVCLIVSFMFAFKDLTFGFGILFPCSRAVKGKRIYSAW